jgi:uncharacterized membrane protein (DUF485 family)
MNKVVTIILLVLAIALIAYNATLIDFQDPLNGNSIIAIIGILAALCAIVLLLIFITSRKIEKKIKDN